MVVAVMMMTVVVVVVLMAVAVTMAAVGAALGREGLAHVAHPGTKAQEHRRNDVIATDQDAVRLDLRRQMAVADVPGEDGECTRVGGTDFEEIFLGRDHFDMAPVVEEEAVAIGQCHRLGEVDKDAVTVLQGQDLAAEVAFVVGKDDEVEGDHGRVAGEGCGTQHGHEPQNRK
jgi:hypothetical protein